nr:hypothetical protein CFP56_09850 [Quercus suber]
MTLDKVAHRKRLLGRFRPSAALFTSTSSLLPRLVTVEDKSDACHAAAITSLVALTGSPATAKSTHLLRRTTCPLPRRIETNGTNTSGRGCC